MNIGELLLIGTGEEASEIGIAATELATCAGKTAQMIAKNLRFGISEVLPGQPLTNAERLHLELDDMAAMVELLNERCGLGYVPSRENIERKKAKFMKFSAYSRELGILDGPQ